MVADQHVDASFGSGAVKVTPAHDPNDWDIAQRHVPEALLLPDDAIRHAQLTLWKEFKLAVEPAAALGLAALQSGAVRPQRDVAVALILCGANLDPATLA